MMLAVDLASSVTSVHCFWMPHTKRPSPWCFCWAKWGLWSLLLWPLSAGVKSESNALSHLSSLYRGDLWKYWVVSAWMVTHCIWHECANGFPWSSSFLCCFMQRQDADTWHSATKSRVLTVFRPTLHPLLAAFRQHSGTERGRQGQNAEQ